MISTPENNDPRCLWQATLFEVAEKLTRSFAGTNRK